MSSQQEEKFLWKIRKLFSTATKSAKSRDSNKEVKSSNTEEVESSYNKEVESSDNKEVGPPYDDRQTARNRRAHEYILTSNCTNGRF